MPEDDFRYYIKINFIVISMLDLVSQQECSGYLKLAFEILDKIGDIIFLDQVPISPFPVASNVEINRK